MRRFSDLATDRRFADLADQPRRFADLAGPTELQPFRLFGKAFTQSLADKPAMMLRGVQVYTPGTFGDSLLEQSSMYLESLKDPKVVGEIQKAASGRLWPIGDDQKWYQVEAKHLPETINAWAANVGDQIPIMLSTLAGRALGKIIGKPIGVAAGAATTLLTGGPDPSDVVTAPAVAGVTSKVVEHLGGAAPLVAMEAGNFMDEANNLGIDKDIAEKYARIYGLGSGAIEYSQWIWALGVYRRLGNPVQKTILKRVLGEIGGTAVEGLEEISQEGLQNKLLQKAVGEMKERNPDYTGEAPETWAGWKRAGAIGAGVAAITRLPGHAMTMAQGRLSRQQTVEESLPEELKAVPEAKPAEKQIADITQKPTKPIPKETVTPPVVQREMSQEGIGPVNLTTESQDAVNVLDRYWRLRDEAEFEANVDEAANQEAIAEALGKKRYNPDVDIDTAQTSQAMMLYIDLKEHPKGHNFADQLTKEQRQIYELSQNLPPNIRQIADRIAEQNKKAGQLLKDQDVIRNVRENYIAHIWKHPTRERPLFAKFRQKTARALPRRLEGGIMEGWSRDMTLEVKDVAAASRIARQQGTRALAGKKLLDLGKNWGLMGHKQLEGWTQVEHPNFTVWRHAGKAETGKVYGRDLYVNEKGELFERSPVYAEPKLAAKLNRIFSPSALYKLPGVETITFYNDQIKATILITALFHHQAFLRSNMLGGRSINFRQAWKDGKQAIKNKEPELRLLIQNGMTLGKIQDYDPAFLTGRQTIWGRVLSQTNLTEKGRKFMVNLRNRQVSFLFHKMGPYLKAGTALLELQANTIKNKDKLARGEITMDEIAESVAVLMNNDFGGLHLGRLGRGATAQHIFKLLALAPDWTESNIKSATQMLNRGEMGRVHRLFWGRIAAKGLGATILFNLLLAGFDDDDFVTRYRKAWETGRLRWLDIDITPIYRALGGSTERRKYFSLLGHFRDPVKFVAHPFVSAKHKGSVVGRIMLDLMIGQDWAGREFTTLGELTGITEKGKLSGRLVKWSRGKARPVEPGQVPSYALYELRSAMPIPIQNAIAFIGGEMDAFDAITKSLGLMTFTTYPSQKQTPKTLFRKRKSIFRKTKKKRIFKKAG